MDFEKKKSTMICFRLSEEDREVLKNVKDRYNTTESEIIRTLVKQYCRNYVLTVENFKSKTYGNH